MSYIAELRTEIQQLEATIAPLKAITLNDPDYAQTSARLNTLKWKLEAKKSALERSTKRYKSTSDRY